jgi:hypothetical protein
MYQILKIFAYVEYKYIEDFVLFLLKVKLAKFIILEDFFYNLERLKYIPGKKDHQYFHEKSGEIS